MSYQLDFLSVIKAHFIPVNITSLLMYGGIFLIIAGTGLYQYKKNNNGRYLGIMLGLALLIPAFAIMTTSYVHTGDGWRLESDKLIIKAKGSYVIDIPSAKAVLIDNSNPWQSAIRTYGLSLSGLSSGRFKLNNGKNAVVFRHMISTKTLILLSNDRYYILSHPGVEMLYLELVNRGVEQNDL